MPHCRTRINAVFPDFTNIEAAIAAALPNVFRPSNKSLIEIVGGLKVKKLFGSEVTEKAETWFKHVKKTFLAIQCQGNFPEEQWAHTTTCFLQEEIKAWWAYEKDQLPEVENEDWKVFKARFKIKYLPLEYRARKKREFIELRQGNMTVTEYHRKFIDLSCYWLIIANDPSDVLLQFKKGTRKQLQYLASGTPCITCQKFYEGLVRIEESENGLNDIVDEASGSS
ncbi:uncharacterized protein LOC125476040 [Pyrus x bretschneideri]|uniref:uncharacterized protein LOC125476040 n=1 Tax=Pyrus x bretschneideri TaxID=225117 RepID=UPI00202FB530|nr:uncharacterized protein LOC125476040 [Pyrus x bretschneideri]